MTLLELIFISVALAMDCFAVSFSAGAGIKELPQRTIWVMALLFGLFQAGMTLIGWLGGEMVVQYLSRIDHWIAFGLLSFIGGRMVYEGCHPEKENSTFKSLGIGTLLVLSVATSIDALAIGFSFSVISVNIVRAIIYIGLASFLLSHLGTFLGRKISHHIKPQYAEIIGGIILIIIGLKILIEHLM